MSCPLSGATSGGSDDRPSYTPAAYEHMLHRREISAVSLLSPPVPSCGSLHSHQYNPLEPRFRLEPAEPSSVVNAPVVTVAISRPASHLYQGSNRLRLPKEIPGQVSPLNGLIAARLVDRLMGDATAAGRWSLPRTKFCPPESQPGMHLAQQAAPVCRPRPVEHHGTSKKTTRSSRSGLSSYPNSSRRGAKAKP